VGVKNRCPLTPVVSKTSSGALEFQDIFCVENPAKFFLEAKEFGYQIIAADSGDRNYSKKFEISELKNLKNSNKIIVMGSEGSGISQNIQQVADSCVSIYPENDLISKFPYSLVDSLNVSVASAIILQACVKNISDAEK
jgi:21S rRNA (GM2251-2'-O)-methyltransferase